MEETLNIKEIFSILKKRWKLIVFITLIVSMFSGIVSYFVLKPVYQASTQMLVNQKSNMDQLDVNQLKSNVELINTYSVIIKSSAILEKVKQNYEFTESIEQLNQKITINSQNNSQVFSLTVQDNDAANAAKIANAVSETFQKEIKTIMNVDNVKILSKAVENYNPVKPNPLSKITTAMVIGLMLGVALVFLLEYMDNTIKDVQDTETFLELPVLGAIQKFSKNHRKVTTTQKAGGESIGS
ncbi:YveK family protein [Peribacillus asahii]|uniref:YveK family protein n=1 Tax=Peribacillus asahii TaxID=228899 RepID=UPI0038101713